LTSKCYWFVRERLKKGETENGLGSTASRTKVQPVDFNSGRSPFRRKTYWVSVMVREHFL